MRTTDSVTRRFIGATFTILITSMMAMPSLADSVTIKGTNVSDDVSIFFEAPNASYSYWFYDYVGAYGGGTGVRRTLLRFDVSALAGQFTQITSIKLNLFPNSQDAPGNANVGTLQVYQIATNNSSWFEGQTQGGTAVPPESSWNFRNAPSTTWAGAAGLSNGVDYTTLLGSANYDNTTPLNDTSNPLGGGISFGGGNAALTALINSWLTPGGNAGLLLRASNETTGDDRVIKLNTADNLSPSTLYPVLVVTFIPEPTTALLALSGAVLLWRRRSKNSATRRSIGAIFTVLIAATLMMPSLSQATTLTFQEGVSPSATYNVLDTELRAGPGNTNSSFEVNARWNVADFAAGITEREAVGFLITNIPAGSIVTSIKLDVVTAGGSGPDRVVELHSMTNLNFNNESTATWNSANTGSPWANPGGDFSATIMSSFTVIGNTTGDQYTFGSTPAFVAAANSALAGDGLLRLIVKATDETTVGYKSFWASDEGGVTHPLLTITFVPEPTSLGLIALGGAFLIWRRRSR